MAGGQFCIGRRAVAALCLGMLGATAALAAGEGTGLFLEVGAPGSLRIINAAAGPVTVAQAITVEAQTDVGWRAVSTEFNAIARCGDAGTAAAVHLSPGAVLDVMPWLGFTCSGQCPRPCRANVRYAAGRYRFAVMVLPSGARVTGPEFWLPAKIPPQG